MMDKYIGKLIGNTGNPNDLKIALENSFSAKRGEFVKIKHRESEEDGDTYVLGRIVSISRSNILFNSNMGEGLSSLEILPGAQVTGETLFGTIELVGYRDNYGQIKIPRRPLNPGEKVYGVDYEFLSKFYKFDENTSINIGNLIGYDKGSNIVPVYLDVNKLVTEHLAVLAMTGSGKSYTVGRIIERLVAEMNGTVVVFDVHGEYGKAFEKGEIHFNNNLDFIEDEREKKSIQRIQEQFLRLIKAGGGIKVYTPQMDSFDYKYSAKNHHLALQFDRFDMDDLSSILPDLTEAQERVLDVAIRYWKAKYNNPPRDIQDLTYLLSDEQGLEELKNWDNLTEGEAKALNNRSAAVASMKLTRVINEAKSFYTRAIGEPTDIYEMIGEKGNNVGRLVIIDLQGLSDDAKQIITALISSEIMRAASDKKRQIRPCFLVYEEGHNFAPAGIPSISKKIIKKIAAEGRKFGTGFAIISQRPSKLDPDVTSQCNTIITMRLKNPDDQRFIAKTSDMFSTSDIEELPSLSTGEALINGRSIPAPLLVKIGTKALIHGGESPEVIKEWGVFNE
ncbi:nucleoside triphosphate hydrolase [Thermoanaerobacterium thermosaccharolyticum]|uniref:Nucleoside triphosphate hydrolase n=2 Tax=Thermoanaerobacterium thermosaccharolyticum TaxID=1517 RepID=A0A223I013_THETR|nr:nucleoside triphosphate hydrolase [Thermoanaerobacterium thermosaccharolyticum]